MDLLPASDFLLQHLLPSAASVGRRMARGLVLCAESKSLPFTATPRTGRGRKLRKALALDEGRWVHRDERPSADVLRVDVPPYDPREVETMVSYYRLMGTWNCLRGPGHVEAAARDLHVVTASRGDLLRRLCSVTY